MDTSWMTSLPVYELELESLKASVTPVGGQVLSLSCNGQDILYTGSAVKRSGIPILFPFANPLANDRFNFSRRSMGQHGFARKLAWNLEHHSQNSTTMSLNHTNLNKEMNAFYPFEFEVYLSISLADLEGPALIMQIEVRNLGDAPMPIAPGLHPYFSLQHSLKSTLKCSGVESFDATTIDWEAPSNGQFFPWISEGVFDFGTHRVRVETSKGVFPYCVVWSQNTSQPDHDFVCLEPFTRPSNGLNIDPVLVKRQKPWSASYRITMQDYL